jgi:hypothetical protein
MVPSYLLACLILVVCLILQYATRIGAGAPVYLAAVLEYLAAEVTKLLLY